MSEKFLWLINPAEEIKRGLDKFWVYSQTKKKKKEMAVLHSALVLH